MPGPLPYASVEGLCTKFCMKLPERRTTTLVSTVMKWKVRDAWTVVRKKKYNNTKVWRERASRFYTKREWHVPLTTYGRKRNEGIGCI